MFEPRTAHSLNPCCRDKCAVFAPITDLDDAEIGFQFQVDRQGRRQPLKTEESRRTVEIPRQLAAMLNALHFDSKHQAPTDFVFATSTGRVIQQRNVTRALRRAQKAAVDDIGSATFPILHNTNENDKPVTVPRGAVPTFHSFRHSAASEAIGQGDSAEEIAWQLGHKNSVITRTVYTQEIKNAERKARRRKKMEERYGAVLEGASEPRGSGRRQQKADDDT